MVRGGTKEPKEIVEGVFPPILPKKERGSRIDRDRRNRTKNRPGPNTKMHWIGIQALTDVVRAVAQCRHVQGLVTRLMH